LRWVGHVEGKYSNGKKEGLILLNIMFLHRREISVRINLTLFSTVFPSNSLMERRKIKVKKGRPRSKWMDYVLEDVKKLNINNW
jgi:hypothetical protein